MRWEVDRSGKSVKLSLMDLRSSPGNIVPRSTSSTIVTEERIRKFRTFRVWTSRVRLRDVNRRLARVWTIPSMHLTTRKLSNGLLCGRAEYAGGASVDVVVRVSMTKFCRFGNARIMDIIVETEHRGDQR